MHGLGIAQPLRYPDSADLPNLQRCNWYTTPMTTITNDHHHLLPLSNQFTCTTVQGMVIDHTGHTCSELIYDHCTIDHCNQLRGEGQTFFRAFINSELGPPEVASCMARTFGGVSGHRRQTRSEPRPAQIWSQK